MIAQLRTGTLLPSSAMIGAGRRRTRGLPLAYLYVLLLLLAPSADAAESADSVSVRDSVALTTAKPPVARRCSPWAAFTLGLVIPGGGQFYTGDWVGGIEAIASDIVIFEALRRSESTNRSIAFFIGSMHLVEAIFAVRTCRLRREEAQRAYSASVQRDAGALRRAETISGSRPSREGWRIAFGIGIPLPDARCRFPTPIVPERTRPQK